MSYASTIDPPRQEYCVLQEELSSFTGWAFENQQRVDEHVGNMCQG